MLVKCETCKIEFNKPRCHGVRSKKHFCTRECYRNRIVEKLKNCSLCNKEIDHSKKSYSKKYCSICYKTEYYKKKPEKREKDRKRAFEKTRIRKGLPLDHPHLKAKAGEGNNTKHGYRLLWKPGHPNRKNGAGIRNRRSKN